ncbi:tail fiber assembly protein [Pseudosulfitobacter sp. DSM 107133]|uniref:tail fiber assembly protein n=1 Tax=Pseudosulfitobacter sp. DSM 107133 TaxID=2883100 RepID=UPI000DF39224|nr:tail fiber assembly protein [Pseudosulfitobacter sp. DSM 107133]UOA25892.1 hypothetical protein DSM107133_00581 [Pseudosulfitobacter sp. DSM 107133]
MPTLFLVYDNTLGTASARPIIRWGEAADADLSLQEHSASETAVENTSGLPFDPDETTDYKYYYDPSTGDVSFSGLLADPWFYSSESEEYRTQRDTLLAECDWTQLPDTALSASCVTDFATYRQALRDVPQQGGFPSTITWPTRPTEVNA